MSAAVEAVVTCFAATLLLMLISLQATARRLQGVQVSIQRNAYSGTWCAGQAAWLALKVANPIRVVL